MPNFLVNVVFPLAEGPAIPINLTFPFKTLSAIVSAIVEICFSWLKLILLIFQDLK